MKNAPYVLGVALALSWSRRYNVHGGMQEFFEPLLYAEYMRMVAGMRFYIASKLENCTQVRTLAEKLSAAGWVHTYDWTCDWTKQGFVKPTNRETLESIGKREFEGVSDADVVIVLTPQGRGTHIELGMAIALDKTVFLCHADDTYFKCDDNTCSFYCLPKVIQLIGNTEEIAESILSYQAV